MLEGRIAAPRLLVVLGLAKSNNEARQKIQEGAVTIGEDREKYTDPRGSIAVTDGLIVRLGSRRIARVRLV
jgi:tyrosyl-tRNA synthetase